VLRSRISWGHGPLVLNEHVNVDGTFDQAKVLDTIVVDDRSFDPSFRDGREALHLAQGGTLGRVHKGLAYLQLRGRILVPDATRITRLADRERDLRAAFDPYLCAFDSPTTDGAYTLSWNEPTADADFPSGVIPIQVYARPTVAPRIDESVVDREMRRFAVGLVTADPRMYHQSESTLVLTPAAATGDVINLGNVPAPLSATIVMSGAGHASFTITRAGVAFIMSLTSMVNLDQVVVIHETSGPFGRGKYITKNGTENFALKTSGADTWLSAPVGTTSFVMTNHTNVTSCTLAWRSAWA